MFCSAPQLDFVPEQYTDSRELRALATLITPRKTRAGRERARVDQPISVGIKSVAERLTSMIVGQLLEIVALVRTRPAHALLREARKSYVYWWFNSREGKNV